MWHTKEQVKYTRGFFLPFRPSASGKVHIKQKHVFLPPYFHSNQLCIFQIEAVSLHSHKVTMFSSRFLVVLTFVVLISYVVSAAKEKRLTTQSATLGVNQTKRVCRRVVLRVNSIEDSRCPVNVQCIWEGQAKVKLTLSTTTASNTVELIIGAQASPAAQVTLGSVVYTVTLQDVIPYPGTRNTAPKAVIEIVCP